MKILVSHHLRTLKILMLSISSGTNIDDLERPWTTLIRHWIAV